MWAWLTTWCSARMEEEAQQLEDEVVEKTKEKGLEEELRAHSTHFASMVDLIPAKFYVIKDNDEADSSLDSKYWVNKKKQKKPPKQALKEVTKKAKRLKLDPESHKPVVELQAELNKATTKEEAESSNAVVANGVSKAFSVEHVLSTSLNGLQERLKEKIENFRRKRKAPERSESGVDEEAPRKKQKRTEKQKRKKALQQKKKHLVQGSWNVTNKNRTEELTRPSIKDEETGRIVFSKFDFSTPVQEVALKEQAPKKKNYKKLLAKAEATQKKLEELKRKDEKQGEEVEKKLQWQKALDMARGEKLKDDSKLLKKTTKRLEKRKHKSSKEWEERKESEKQAKERRQEKRKRNIQERVDQVKAKKIKKRAKKSGVRRPGF